MDIALIAVILLALAFDFSNGFHDAANSIATVVSTRVLAPRMAVAWAAFFNFAAFLIFGTHVATTIAKGVVDQDVLTLGVVFSGLVGAIGWDLLTFWFGLPTSSSHALARLFSGEYDALEVLRWKDIIEAMEAALNTLEDVSNVVESIVLKHA